MNWAQLSTVLWLRWRLTRNQWAKSGGLGALLAAVVAVAVLVISALLFAGGLAAGILALRASQPMVVMVVWLALTAAFLFMWLIGLITELQRSESIDLQRLMHLPVRLGQIFVVNYIVSHLSISVLFFVPAATGLAIGLAISRGPAMLLLVPLSFGVLFMVTAWTYCLRGWLAAMMSNPRRRRAIVMGLTMALILIVQAPNLYFSVFSGRDRPVAGETREARAERRARERAEMAALLEWQVAVPPLWVPVGARALAEGRALPAIFGAFGALAIGSLGLRRAYLGTLRFYSGGTGGAQPRPRAPTARSRPDRDRTVFLERRLPAVPDGAAAIALATFQSMLRAPEIKMQWGTSFLVTLIVGGSLLFRSGSRLSPAAGPFVATGVVVFSIFLMVSLVGNQFGFDRDGFRALVLSPIERRFVILGKNLAALPAAAASATILLTVVSFWLHLPPLVMAASFFQLATGLCLTMIAGNAMSIFVPYRIQPGSMKPTKMPALATVVLVVSQLSLPVALTPTFVPPLAGWVSERAGGPPAGVVNLVLSTLLATVAAMAYWQSLAPFGRLLQRRETRILQTVSAEVE